MIEGNTVRFRSRHRDMYMHSIRIDWKKTFHKNILYNSHAKNENIKIFLFLWAGRVVL